MEKGKLAQYPFNGLIWDGHRAEGRRSEFGGAAWPSSQPSFGNISKSRPRSPQPQVHKRTATVRSCARLTAELLCDIDRCLQIGVSSARVTFRKIRGVACHLHRRSPALGQGGPARSQRRGPGHRSRRRDPSPAPQAAASPGARCPRLEEDQAGSYTCAISDAVPSFRSHIKSTSFLLRQQDLPAEQAARTMFS